MPVSVYIRDRRAVLLLGLMLQPLPKGPVSGNDKGLSNITGEGLSMETSPPKEVCEKQKILRNLRITAGLR